MTIAQTLDESPKRENRRWQDFLGLQRQLRENTGTTEEPFSKALGLKSGEEQWSALFDRDYQGRFTLLYTNLVKNL